MQQFLVISNILLAIFSLSTGILTLINKGKFLDKFRRKNLTEQEKQYIANTRLPSAIMFFSLFVIFLFYFLDKVTPLYWIPFALRCLALPGLIYACIGFYKAKR